MRAGSRSSEAYVGEPSGPMDPATSASRPATSRASRATWAARRLKRCAAVASPYCICKSPMRYTQVSIISPDEYTKGLYKLKIWSKFAPSEKWVFVALGHPPNAPSIVTSVSFGNRVEYLAMTFGSVGR